MIGEVVNIVPDETESTYQISTIQQDTDIPKGTHETHELDGTAGVDISASKNTSAYVVLTQTN